MSHAEVDQNPFATQNLPEQLLIFWALHDFARVFLGVWSSPVATFVTWLLRACWKTGCEVNRLSFRFSTLAWVAYVLRLCCGSVFIFRCLCPSSDSLSWHPSTLKAKDTKMQLKWMKNRVPNVRCELHCGTQNRKNGRTVAIAWSSRAPLRWFSCFTLGFCFCFNYLFALFFGFLFLDGYKLQFDCFKLFELIEVKSVVSIFQKCTDFGDWFGLISVLFWALMNRPKRSVKSNVRGKQLTFLIPIKGA